MPADNFDPLSRRPGNEYKGPHRNGETGLIPPRSRRFYFNGQHWFFRTRERIAFGPHDTFRAAEQGLKLYLRRCGIIHFTSEPRPVPQ